MHPSLPLISNPWWEISIKNIYEEENFSWVMGGKKTLKHRLWNPALSTCTWRAFLFNLSLEPYNEFGPYPLLALIS